MAKAKIQHIPYRGSPQGITDLLAQRVDFQVDTPAVLMPFISDGRLRPIAVTGPKGFFLLPGVPTIGETVPGYTVTSWLGVAGPAGLPPAFVTKVNEEIKAILAEPDVIERLRKLGSDVVPTTPQGFRDRVADDVTKWTKVVADANIPRV
jgi:tripartite-type tricarboxylate transporter receptor subunit TctC